MKRYEQNWFPISPKQKIIIGMTLGSDSCLSMTTGLKIVGALDKTRLESAIQYIFDTNDALRFVFKKDGEVIYQSILEKYEYTLTEYCLNGSTENEKESELMLHSRSMIPRHELFDGTIMAQVILYTINENTHVLFIAMSHLITDGVSGTIVLKKIIEAYNRYESKCTKLTYLDYLQEEAIFARSEEGKAQINFWKKEMEGYSDAFFPTPKGNRIESSVGYYFDIEFKSLAEFAYGNKFSLAVTNMFLSHIALSAAFNITDTAFAIADANRDKKYRDTIGCFVSCSMDRLIVDADMTLFELLKLYSARYTSNSENARLGAYVEIPKLEFTYLNYVTNEQQKWPFGDAYVELCAGLFEDMRLIWEFVLLAVVEVRAQNKIIYNLGCDDQTFPLEYRQKFVSYFKRAMNGLISKTMSFHELMDSIL